MFAPRLAEETIGRLWTMMAHQQIEQRYVVYPVTERFPLRHGAQAIGLQPPSYLRKPLSNQDRAGIPSPRSTAGRATNAASVRFTFGKSWMPTRSPAS